MINRVWNDCRPISCAPVSPGGDSGTGPKADRSRFAPTRESRAAWMLWTGSLWDFPHPRPPPADGPLLRPLFQRLARLETQTDGAGAVEHGSRLGIATGLSRRAFCAATTPKRGPISSSAPADILASAPCFHSGSKTDTHPRALPPIHTRLDKCSERTGSLLVSWTRERGEKLMLHVGRRDVRNGLNAVAEAASGLEFRNKTQIRYVRGALLKVALKRVPARGSERPTNRAGHRWGSGARSKA